MGQAKKRGTLEQRIEQAEERTRRLQMEMSVLPDDHPVKLAYRKVGARKLSGIIASTFAGALLSQLPLHYPRNER